MSEFFGFNPATGGATALLAIAVLFVLTGRLVPRSVLRDTQADRDYWRAAHDEEAKARAAERELTNELLEVAKTADRVIAALPQAPSSREVTASGLDRAPDSTR
ncbi:hypothetical protein [Streptomyces griseofuscus]|uniref:Uncharacterized protein n=1 Tax=Streptomyces griseofuscus TaxID=146922 RepID=A0A426RZ99_9ACTN|nr:hypothetical protein [Streptomyces griseofuscus]RRQ81577.1 hypothetical protein CQW44_30725 [Streptomyces griseofuscus]